MQFVPFNCGKLADCHQSLGRTLRTISTVPFSQRCGPAAGTLSGITYAAKQIANSFGREVYADATALGMSPANTSSQLTANQNMKTNNKTQHYPSTYALLVRSEERERSLSETFVYLLLIGSAAFSMWYAALHPFRVPVVSVADNTTSTQAAAPARI